MTLIARFIFLFSIAIVLQLHFAVAHDGKDHSASAPLHVFPAESMEVYDAEVFDQSGGKLRFVSEGIAGKRFVITFFYSKCETFCPAYHALFQALQDELPKRKLGDVQLISVSIDPQNDGIKELRTLADGLAAGPRWRLVSGAPEEAYRLLRSLGVPRGKPEDHPPMFLVGNARVWRMQRLIQMPSIEEVVRLLEHVVPVSGALPAMENVP